MTSWIFQYCSRFEFQTKTYQVEWKSFLPHFASFLPTQLQFQFDLLLKFMIFRFCFFANFLIFMIWMNIEVWLEHMKLVEMKRCRGVKNFSIEKNQHTSWQTQVHNIFKTHITKSSINQSIFEVTKQIWQQNFIRSKIHVNVQRSARYWICEVNIVHALVFQGLIVTTWLFECLNYGEIVAILDLRVRNNYILNWKLWTFFYYDI